jgi:DMSO/TMAO reductase YedYZ molybdopterin-dependent catalytic subunit
MAAQTLPPGQRAIQGFPRFGTHFHAPPPATPADPVLAIGGAVMAPISMPLARLATLPRREITADLHCVAGWSATGLRWEGVAFATLYREVIAPVLPTGPAITHVVFEGLDRYRSIVQLEDALGDDVLIADHLNSRPLDGDHGAPVRLVSPSQYGFISTKHLCRIELHTAEPRGRYHPSRKTQLWLDLVKPHRRARVWREERHRYLPATLVRPLYHRLVPTIRALSSRRGIAARPPQAATRARG